MATKVDIVEHGYLFEEHMAAKIDEREAEGYTLKFVNVTGNQTGGFSSKIGAAVLTFQN